MKGPEDLKRHYGKAYVERFESGQSPDRLERLLPHIALEPAWDVADFACGSAMLMPLLAPRVRSYTGVDFSEDFIAAATAKRDRLGLRNAVLHCGSIERFCAAHPGRFDAAFAMDVSEHVYDAEWSVILAGIFGSLKPGGRLYLHTPNARFFLEVMKRHNFIVKQLPEHIAVRTPEANAALVEAAGFRIRRVRLLPHYNVLRHLHVLARLPLVGRYFEARIFIEAQRAS
jgi:SAM-dependent methyltransferase